MSSSSGWFSAANISRLRQNRKVRLGLRALQVLVVAGVLAFLLLRISEIGWVDVWRSLPNTPWFYVLFCLMYLAMPVTEMMAFERIWGMKLRRSFPIFLRKRVYNFAVVSYSGEAYLALWARKHLPLSSRQILSTVKDNNILSALASNSFTLILLAVFVAVGPIEQVIDANPDVAAYFAIAGAVGALLVFLVVKFRQWVLAVPREIAGPVLAIHVGRNIAMLVLQTLQWAVVFPEVPLMTWLMFLTAQLLLTRIPFLPNQDLLLIGLGMSLMAFIDAPEAAIAGMFLASAALFQVVNVVIYATTSIGSYRPADTLQSPVPETSGQ